MSKYPVMQYFVNPMVIPHDQRPVSRRTRIKERKRNEQNERSLIRGRYTRIMCCIRYFHKLCLHPSLNERIHYPLRQFERIRDVDLSVYDHDGTLSDFSKLFSR